MVYGESAGTLGDVRAVGGVGVVLAGALPVLVGLPASFDAGVLAVVELAFEGIFEGVVGVFELEGAGEIQVSD